MHLALRGDRRRQTGIGIGPDIGVAYQPEVAGQPPRRWLLDIPAARGPVVSLWGTGFDPTDPPFNAPGPGDRLQRHALRFRWTVRAGTLRRQRSEPGAHLFFPVSVSMLPGGESITTGSVGVTIAVK